MNTIDKILAKQELEVVWGDDATNYFLLSCNYSCEDAELDIYEIEKDKEILLEKEIIRYIR